MAVSDADARWGQPPPQAVVPRVLIVDDQLDIRRLLTISLGNDYEVLQAADGLTALEMVQLHQPSLILLDVMLPGELDGLQVLDRIRAHPAHQHIVVAMVTARGQVIDQHAALTRGADAYFTKPFSPLAVRSWIRDALNKVNPASDFLPL
jgi:DNA-binding response OmpR family regulator